MRLRSSSSDSSVSFAAVSAASSSLSSAVMEPTWRFRWISRSDTVKGYEYAPDQYVVITDEDLDKVPLKTVRSIEIDLVLGLGFLLTVHDRGWDPRTAHHLRRGPGPILAHGPDHLLWALCDDIVDAYFDSELLKLHIVRMVTENLQMPDELGTGMGAFAAHP